MRNNAAMNEIIPLLRQVQGVVSKMSCSLKKEKPISRGGRGKKTKKQPVRTIVFGAGRWFIVRRPHFARTPFKYGLVATSRL
jgi:hypothetical protein